MHNRDDPIVRSDIHAILAACRAELAQLCGKTLVLTGASGFVGAYLLETLVALNEQASGDARCHVLLPTRDISAARAKWPNFFGVPGIEWCEWEELKLHLTRCDFLIHAASPSDPVQYLGDAYSAMLEMAATTRQVLDFSRKVKVGRLLYLSSGAVYGIQRGTVDTMSESYEGAPDLHDPRSCYGETKRYCELLCRVSGVPSVIARLFSFIGPYQDLSSSFAAPDFIRQACTQGHIRIRGDGTALRTYCYASDLAIALWKLLLNGTIGEAYNVGQGGEPVSILELARVIGRVVGQVEITVEGAESSISALRNRYLPDINKLSALVSPRTSLEDAVARTVSSLYFQGKISSTPTINGNVTLEEK